ncbi:hypothetical protein ACN6MY_15720 [Peribacillus sp. B-H-3]|uniref:hypothetical protein n=1 Tax=Peribacillus sp. B-H-3 TaxID=3400420 RepID=UPI003B016D95
MEACQIKEIFENSSYGFLYKKFHYQLFVSGLLDDIDDSELIERFLDSYCFEQNVNLCFDNFSFYFKTYYYSYIKHDLQNHFLY